MITKKSTRTRRPKAPLLTTKPTNNEVYICSPKHTTHD